MQRGPSFGILGSNAHLLDLGEQDEGGGHAPLRRQMHDILARSTPGIHIRTYDIDQVIHHINVAMERGKMNC